MAVFVQAIAWSSDDLIHWRVYASLDLNVATGNTAISHEISI